MVRVGLHPENRIRRRFAYRRLMYVTREMPCNDNHPLPGGFSVCSMLRLFLGVTRGAPATTPSTEHRHASSEQ